MTARFDRAWAKASRANLAAWFGSLRALPASRSASAQGAQEQRRACKLDVDQSVPAKIPDVRASANGLRRQKVNLSEARMAVFEQ